MSKKKIHKTNAMRTLDTLKVAYTTASYPVSSQVDAVHVAHCLHVEPAVVYKTIVLTVTAGSVSSEFSHHHTHAGNTRGHGQRQCGQEHVVALLSAERELNLKKVAHHFGVKSVALLNGRELKNRTGYIRGGCSPIAMKKPFPTVIDSPAEALEHVYISAGELGEQIILSPADLAHVVSAQFADISHTHEQ